MSPGGTAVEDSDVGKPMSHLDPKIMPLSLFTIGHSTHPLDGFLKLLARHEIEALADIRRFPGSRTYPHFNRDCLVSAYPRRASNTAGSRPWEAVARSPATRPGTLGCGTKASGTTPTT